MITFKPAEIKSGNERIMSPYEYDKLVRTNIDVILSARFVPPPLGSSQVLGHVRVKFRPGYRHTSN